MKGLIIVEGWSRKQQDEFKVIPSLGINTWVSCVYGVPRVVDQWGHVSESVCKASALHTSSFWCRKLVHKYLTERNVLRMWITDGGGNRNKVFLPGKGKGFPEWMACKLGVGEYVCRPEQWGMWERKGCSSGRESRGGAVGEQTVVPLVDYRMWRWKALGGDTDKMGWWQMVRVLF